MNDDRLLADRDGRSDRRGVDVDVGGVVCCHGSLARVRLQALGESMSLALCMQRLVEIRVGAV
jgi:hypothetical protein